MEKTGNISWQRLRLQTLRIPISGLTQICQVIPNCITPGSLKTNTDETMKVIITGGTGLIGQALTANLAADKHEIIILSRNPDAHTDTLPKGASLQKWDAQSAEGWGHLAEGADAIINLAGAGIADERWSKKRKALILDSRINAGKAVVAAVQAATNKPRVVIQASAVGYYGAQRDAVLTEKSPAGNDFPAEVSIQWEPATAEVEMMGVRRIIARFGVVLSMSGGALPRMAKPIQLGIGGHIGSGDQWFSWVHIDDVVRSLRFLMADPHASGVYNITGPAPVSNKTFANTIGNVINRPTLLPVPGFAMKALFGEMSHVLLTGQNVVPARLADAGFQFRFPHADNALRDLLTPHVN
jgi:uncharacterized protein (TIGR01777 family)